MSKTDAEKIARLTAERDMARAALERLLADCAAERQCNGFTVVGASFLYNVQRTARGGLGQ